MIKCVAPTLAVTYDEPDAVIEYVAPALAVTCEGIHLRTLMPPSSGMKKLLREQRVKIDPCVNVLKTKVEVLEQHEKKVAVLLARAPRASHHETRDLQRVIDENKVPVLHHRQFVQTCEESLPDAILEKCEQFQLFKRRRLCEP